MEKIAIDFIGELAPNQVVKFPNGRFGVYNFDRKTTKAAGMDMARAADWAHRLNLRDVCGI